MLNYFEEIHTVYIDGLMQERHNFTANALELQCTYFLHWPIDICILYYSLALTWHNTGKSSQVETNYAYFLSSTKWVGGKGRGWECIRVALSVKPFILFVHCIPTISWPLFGWAVHAHFQTNHTLDCTQTWQIHSLLHSPSMIALEHFMVGSCSCLTKHFYFFLWLLQLSYWVWAQPMRDDVTLSLVEPIPRMIPVTITKSLYS